VTLTIVEDHVMRVRDAENIIVNDLRVSVIAISTKCDAPKSPIETLGCGGGISIDGSSKNV
jgi:hypothetical protein